jgi:ribosomal protein L7/L12
MNLDYAKAIENIRNLNETALANVAVTLAKTNPELFNQIIEGKSLISDSLIHAYVKTNQKIAAIKRHREVYGTQLLEAKLAVEELEKFYAK